MSYIETKVRFDKVMENGSLKRVTETYLVDALSFTEAEAKTIEYVTPFISGEFSVSAVRKSNIGEIMGAGADNKLMRDGKFYKVKALFITIDERTGVERKKASAVLVEGFDFDSAYRNFLDGMRSSLADYEIASLCETPILNVLPEIIWVDR